MSLSSEFSYDFGNIEEKWQAIWDKWQLFQGTDGKGEPDFTQEEIYLLFAFAYPSGAGLHVGHVESNTALDILARYHRMNGKQVFFPVGFDAFGLPAENFAIEKHVPPAESTHKAINNFERQIKEMGASYDWKTESITCDPEYYKWTQWIFTQMFEKGLAYKALDNINWCPSCKTILSNEQVKDGRCERSKHLVTQKRIEQWKLRITQYADELIQGLEQVDWPESTKKQQLDWIGRREGVKVGFQVKGAESNLQCFTTRIDTIFGVTFLVISPERFAEFGLKEAVAPDQLPVVEKYLRKVSNRTEAKRKRCAKHKSGVDTGLKAMNPVTGEEIPLFVADYVLGNYGTGVVMGVPGHDERDFEFAQKYDLPIRQVIEAGQVEDEMSAPGSAENDDVDEENDDSTSEAAITEHGVLINSGEFSGLTTAEAQERLVASFPDQMEKTVTYKLRDWTISRQRYWGAPIPIVYDPEGKPHLVKQEHLPWVLPTDVEFLPTGDSPLTLSTELKERVVRLYGEGWTPEYDTMDTFVDSSWYFMRYTDAQNPDEFASQEQLKKLLPVDFYMIGAEHAVLHLLYARFFTKFLRDAGYLEIDEPFPKMRHQGMILGEDGQKMSKNLKKKQVERKEDFDCDEDEIDALEEVKQLPASVPEEKVEGVSNVVNPDDVIREYGADTLRVYEMFMGPIEASKPWQTSQVGGAHRLLKRIHRLVTDTKFGETAYRAEDSTLATELSRVIQKVTEDIPELKFNTAIAAMMGFVNQWESEQKELTEEGKAVLSLGEVTRFVKILAPFAPFLASELYVVLHATEEDPVPNVHLQSWPTPEKSFANETESQVTIPVQVNGKVRARLTVDASMVVDESFVVGQAQKLPELQAFLEGKTVKKVIYAKQKVLNFVV